MRLALLSVSKRLLLSHLKCSRGPRFYAPLVRGGMGQNQPVHPAVLGRALSSASYSGRGAAAAALPKGVPALTQQQQHQQHLQQRSRSFAADSLRQNLERSLYLDFDRRDDVGSPPSDNILFDHMCYATTPSSSNGNSDLENSQQQPAHPPLRSQASAAASPTSRLLLEYEMHLRNTLAKGMDAESCSLHTFEALLTQSMEDLGTSAGRLGGCHVPLLSLFFLAFTFIRTRLQSGFFITARNHFYFLLHCRTTFSCNLLLWISTAITTCRARPLQSI